jgi:hypothetical protein
VIYHIGGPIGSGKTLFTLPWMQDAVRAGRPVYSNIALRPECPFYDDVALIGTEQFPVALEKRRKDGHSYFWEYVEDDAFIVLDEADIEFDSSDYGEMKRETKVYFKQSRKFGHDVICIVQRFSNLYKRIRDLGSRFIVCQHNYRTVRFFHLLQMAFGRDFAMRRSRFLRWEFPWHDCDPREMTGTGFITYPQATQYFGWYDTKQLLGDTSILLRRPTYGTARPGGVGEDQIDAQGGGFLGGDVPVIGPEAVEKMARDLGATRDDVRRLRLVREAVERGAGVAGQGEPRGGGTAAIGAATVGETGAGQETAGKNGLGSVVVTA